MAKRLEDFEKLTNQQVRRSKNLQNQIVSMIQNSYQHSKQLFESKKRTFKDWQLLLTKPSVFRWDIIKVYTALQQRKAFIATYKNEEFSVRFQGRELGDDIRAYKLNSAAKYDYEAMDKANKDYFWLSNLHDYGVGIRIQTGYDEIKKVPTYTVINPEFWIPDPKGNTVDNNFEYHMFLMTTTMGQLISANKANPGKYFNLDKVDESSLIDDEGRLSQKKRHRLIDTGDYLSKGIEIVNCYITIGQRKYLATVSNQRNLLIRFEPITSASKEEEENPYCIPFPVNITNVIPIFEDPYGISPLELIIDKQGAQNRLMNLAIIQEQQHVFRKYLVDPDYVSNMNLLAQPADEGDLFIPASKSIRDNLSTAVVPIGEHVSGDASKVNLSNMMDSLIQQQTGFTNLARGIGSPSGTATEAKIETLNANLMLGLDGSRIALGEKDFWKNIWYRSIQKYLKDTQKKIFRIGSGLVGRTVELSRNDLLSGIDPDVTIISLRQERDKNRKELLAMQQQMPLVLQDPSIPTVSKNIFKRKMWELSGTDPELIAVYVPLSADEQRALHMLELINNDIVPENFFRPGMDLLTYWVYINRAEESELKERVLQALESAMAQQGLAAPAPIQGDQGALRGVGNAMAAQTTSAIISDEREAQNVPVIQQGI